METTAIHEIKKVTWPEKTFLTKRATVSFDNLTAFFTENYGGIYAALGKLGIQPKEMPCAIYYSIDEINKQTDLAAAVPVEGEIPDDTGFEEVTIPASQVVTTTHYGSYESMRPTYEELDNYLSDHHLTRSLIIEEYLSDPAVEKDTSKWKTNIYYIVK